MTSMELRLANLEARLRDAEGRLRKNEDKAANIQQQQQQARGGAGGAPLVRAKTTSTVTARSGTTAGSGSATIYYRDGTTLTATAVTGQTVYNQFGTSVASGTYIWVSYVDDGFELISSDC